MMNNKIREDDMGKRRPPRGRAPQNRPGAGPGRNRPGRPPRPGERPDRGGSRERDRVRSGNSSASRNRSAAPPSKPPVLAILAFALAVLAVVTAVFALLSAKGYKKDIEDLQNALDKNVTSQQSIVKKQEDLAGEISNVYQKLVDFDQKIATIEEEINSIDDKLNAEPEAPSFADLGAYLNAKNITAEAVELNLEEIPGAEKAERYTTAEGATISIYTFDANSETYTAAEAAGQVSFSTGEAVAAHFNNGKALVIDDAFPEKDTIISEFSQN